MVVPAFLVAFFFIMRLTALSTDSIIEKERTYG